MAFAGIPPRPFTLGEKISGSVGTLKPAGGGAATEDKAPRDSEATGIIRMIGLSRAEFFHDPAGDPYVTAPVDDHRETYALSSRGYWSWLNHTLYQRTRKSPSKTAMQAATATLAGVARFEGPTYPVHLRVAECAGALWLDLCNPVWQVIRITSKGWEVVTDGPVRFVRTRGMQPLPVPTRRGSLNGLRPFLNVTDKDFQLVIAWLIAGVRPTGPYPALVPTGEQGTAKSTTARVVRRTIDPHRSDLRRPPGNSEDLMISAVNNHVVTLENVSSMPDWLSDDLAALATGGGLSKRGLYTNTEECNLYAQRPLIINGIGQVVTRPDLLDRSLVLQLQVIPDTKRREESEFWPAFDRAHPAILGALLDAVVMALRNHATVRLPQKPRMADFAVWVVAAEPACPWPAGAFLTTYADHTQDAIEAMLDGDPVGDVVRALAPWSGIATELLKELNERTPEAVRWHPKWYSGPRQVADALRRLAPALRRTGIAVTFEKQSHTRRRLIILERTDDAAASGIAGIAAPDAASPDSANVSGLGDRRDRRDRISLVIEKKEG
jgi:hypothetical protein